MVNSNVLHFRGLVSVSCIEIIVQVKIVILSSVRPNKHMMVPLSAFCERSDYKLVHLNSRIYMYKGEIVQLRSALNHDYNFSGKIKHVPHFRAHNWKILSKPCACTFTSEHFRWFIQVRQETLQHFARFSRLFRLVMWSQSILVPFYILEFLSLFFSFLIL